MDHRDLLLAMFKAAMDAAAPAVCIPPHLPARPRGRTIVVGAGKAAASMAAAFESNWSGELQGLVVTRYGHSVPCERIEVIEAGHPVPDFMSNKAARSMLEIVSGLSADDLVVALLSGGGSALLSAPLPGVSLADVRLLTMELLKSGAAIDEMNCVRRHLGAVAGGRLAAACRPAKVVSLLISDVPGDSPSNIASGPTVGDPTTCDEALGILARLKIAIPASILDLLESGRGESIKPGDPSIEGVETRIVATPRRSLEAAAAVASRAGIRPIILSDRIEGEARSTGKVLAAIARSVADHRDPFEPPCVLLSSGETTVSVRGTGRGGRNSEFLLGMGIALDNHPRIYGLAGDTDGVDGIEEIAGAIWSPDSQFRAVLQGLNPQESLDSNDAHSFFEKLDDGIITGPTRTNVNDFRAILVLD